MLPERGLAGIVGALEYDICVLTGDYRGKTYGAANTYGASIAEVMVGKLLTQERLTELLNSGKISLDGSYLGGMGQLERILHPFQGGIASILDLDPMWGAASAIGSILVL